MAAKETSMTLEDDIEELSFEDSVRPPRKRRTWLRVILAMLLAVLTVGSATGGWYLWNYHLRRIPITVNRVNRLIRVDSTIATLLRDNDDFNTKPGRLLDITGKVLDKRGGGAIVVKRNGAVVATSRLDGTHMADNDVITVESGKDRTEAHTVRYDTVKYGTDIDLNNGPLQEVKQLGKDGKKEIWVGRRSKKEVDKGFSQKPQNLVVQSRSPRPAGRKVIALTFDDGPSQYSDKILDILKEKGVKATFFDVGESAAQYPKQEKRMLAEGHQVASHSNTHPYMPKMGRDELRAEIKAGFDNLKQASGLETRVMRSPYGAFGVEQWKQCADLLDMNVLWDIDTEDWKVPGAQAIHDAVLNNAHNGAVVLMHDGGGDRSQDVEALPGIIDDLKKQGYEFVTVAQLSRM